MKKSICFILVAVLLLMLSGCYDLYATTKRYPWYRATRWYCEEIDMTIEFPVNEDNELTDSPVGYFEYDGQAHNCFIIIKVGNMEIICKNCEIAFYERLLTGTWSYDRNKFVFHIMDDYVFGGQYTELVFIPID